MCNGYLASYCCLKTPARKRSQAPQETLLRLEVGGGTAPQNVCLFDVRRSLSGLSAAPKHNKHIAPRGKESTPTATDRHLAVVWRIRSTL
ncbi:hypothetical protein INR49_029677 [Caranx melampygus]|nr:hypothetical protein INR49_029677 [Caranx melampygus]